MMSCLPCFGRPDTSGVVSAGMEATELAEELVQLSSRTQTRGRNVVDLAGEIKGAFSSINSKMNASTFKAIMDVLNGDKMKDTIALVNELDDLALDCVTKSIQLKETVARGAESLPESVKSESRGDETEVDEGEQELADLGRDITELEECTASLRSMNIFSATTKGTRAFDGLINKGSVIQNTFERIKDLCAIVARVSQNIVSETCCALIQAGIDTAKAIFESLRVSNLIEKLTEAGKRLIDAIKTLVSVAWEKFQLFTEEFQAAKKIKNWVNGMNPINSDAGNLFKQGANLMNSITNTNADLGQNLLCGNG